MGIGIQGVLQEKKRNPAESESGAGVFPKKHLLTKADFAGICSEPAKQSCNERVRLRNKKKTETSSSSVRTGYEENDSGVLRAAKRKGVWGTV